MATIYLEVPKFIKLPTPRNANPTLNLTGCIPMPLPALSNSGTCLLSLPFQAFLLPTLPHPQADVLEPESCCLSQNTWLIPYNPAIGGCRTAPASPWFLPKLLDSSSGQAAHGKQRGGFAILQQKHKCLLLRTGVSFAPRVCENLSLQPAAMKHHGWKLKLQICSVHITFVTLEKNIC